MVITIPVSLLIGVLIGYFWGRSNTAQTKLEGRYEGCKAIEDMVHGRIKECYPKQARTMYENLLQ